VSRTGGAAAGWAFAGGFVTAATGARETDGARTFGRGSVGVG